MLSSRFLERVAAGERGEKINDLSLYVYPSEVNRNRATLQKRRIIDFSVHSLFLSFSSPLSPSILRKGFFFLRVKRQATRVGKHQD